MRSFKAWMCLEIALLRKCIIRTLIYICISALLPYYINHILISNPIFIILIILSIICASGCFSWDSALSIRKDKMMEIIFSFNFYIPVYIFSKLIIPLLITIISFVLFTSSCLISGCYAYISNTILCILTLAILGAIILDSALLLINLSITQNSIASIFNVLFPIILIFIFIGIPILLFNSLLISLFSSILFSITILFVDYLVIKSKKRSKNYT